MCCILETAEDYFMVAQSASLAACWLALLSISTVFNELMKSGTWGSAVK